MKKILIITLFVIIIIILLNVLPVLIAIINWSRIPNESGFLGGYILGWIVLSGIAAFVGLIVLGIIFYDKIFH